MHEKLRCSECSDQTKKINRCPKIDLRGSKKRVVMEIEGKDYYKCPQFDATYFGRYCWELFNHYKNGFLLSEGGIGMQSALYMKAIGYISSVDYDIDKKDKRKEKTYKSPAQQHAEVAAKFPPKGK